MARYKATRDGYCDHYIRAGETFDFDGPAPSWAEAVEEVTAPPEDDLLGELPAKKSHRKKRAD